MQPLSDMTLIGFLDWMDANRYASLSPGMTVEELFLDRGNSQEAERVAAEYLQYSSRRYADSPEGRFEERIDIALTVAKRACMSEFDECLNKWHSLYSDERYVNERILRAINTAVESFLFADSRTHRLLPEVPSSELVSPERLVDSMRRRLDFGEPSQIEAYISRLDGTSAKAVEDFLSYFRGKCQVSNKNDNIPSSVVRTYIERYVDEIYFTRGLTKRKKDELQATLSRAFFADASKSSYFRRITSMRKTSDRYWERSTRYKCVLLAEGREFYELVERHWQELNDYTGDYLDVFYDPDELLVKGYHTADELRIRSSVNSYPSIFVWHTSLSEGSAIPVGPISSCEDDLLSFIKTIVDDIAGDVSFEGIVANARQRIDQYDKALHESENVEELFLRELCHSCSQLQANPDVFGDATENQRNTQIRDLLENLFRRPFDVNARQFQFGVSDQTLRGWSRTGRSSGELDLLVTLDAMPYAIIEALNIESASSRRKNGEHQWKRGYLQEHVRRLGGYDLNGLRRNVVLVYASADDFAGFLHSLRKSLEEGERYVIADDCIYNVSDETERFGDFANLRVLSAKYHYNGLERTLYVVVVGMVAVSGRQATYPK